MDGKLVGWGLFCSAIFAAFVGYTTQSWPNYFYSLVILCIISLIIGVWFKEKPNPPTQPAFPQTSRPWKNNGSGE